MTELPPQTWRRRMVQVRGMLFTALALFFALLLSRDHEVGSFLPVSLSLGLMLLPTLSAWLLGSASEESQRRWLQLELSADVVLFLVLLHLTGGTDNPIAFYLLVPVLVAALSCSTAFTLSLWCAACVGWGVLLQWHMVPASGTTHHDMSGVHPTHSLGMWAVFALLGLLLAALGQQIQRQGASLRRREALSLDLALQRERMYQLATRQADLAHEISTPLNSLVWLLDELPGTNAEKSDATLSRMRECVRRITDALRREPAAAGVSESIGLSDLCKQVALRTSMLMPEMTVRFAGDNDPALANPELWQRVLNNLVYNACDAHASLVEVRASEESGNLVIQVADNGPAAAPGPRQAQGLGIGLALVETSLASIGGQVALLHSRDWTVARIQCPVTALAGHGASDIIHDSQTASSSRGTGSL